jgi:hypothetical protein
MRSAGVIPILQTPALSNAILEKLGTILPAPEVSQGVCLAATIQDSGAAVWTQANVRRRTGPLRPALGSSQAGTAAVSYLT